MRKPVNGPLKPEAPWWRSARYLTKVDEGNGWSSEFSSRSTWLADAATRLGRSTTQIRRYLASWRFVESLVSSHRLGTPSAAVRIPEVTLTALLRLDRVSPKTVDAFLAQGPDEVPPFRVVLRELERHSRANTPNLGPRERSRRLPGWFHRDCISFLQKNRHALSKDHNSGIVREVHLWWLLVDAVFIDSNFRWSDGCRIVFTEPNRAFPASLKYEIFYAAQFFRYFWVVVPPAAAHALTEVGLYAEVGPGFSNVGLVTFDGTLKVVRKPRYGDAGVDLPAAFLKAIRAAVPSVQAGDPVADT